MTKSIFLDNHSTTPVDPRVANVVLAAMEVDFGNAGSTDHSIGDIAKSIVEESRKQVQKLILSAGARVVFTSGSTESINIVLNNMFSQKSGRRKRFVLSPLEHSAVLETSAWWEKKGELDLAYLEVDGQGRIDLAELKRLLQEPTDLVSVMAANNEIGNIYPIEQIAQICKSAKVPYLCDATQAVGKIPLAYDAWGLHYLVFSAHKMYGPKGVGALVLPREEKITPLIFGGGQEFGIRSGTLNVPGIAGFGEACRFRKLEMYDDEQRVLSMRDHLQKLITDALPEALVNGDLEHRLAGNLHLAIPGVVNDAVIMRVRDKLAISRGATCSSGIEQPSHVLRAMHFSDSKMEGSFRFCVGKFNTEQEIDDAAELFINAVRAVQQKLRGKPLEHAQ